MCRSFRVYVGVGVRVRACVGACGASFFVRFVLYKTKREQKTRDDHLKSRGVPPTKGVCAGAAFVFLFKLERRALETLLPYLYVGVVTDKECKILIPINLFLFFELKETLKRKTQSEAYFVQVINL